MWATTVCHQFATRMKEHQSAVRQQGENSILTLRFFTTGHAFYWTRASMGGNASRKRTWEFLRPGVQHERVLTSTRHKTRATKPCKSIGSARARNHKPSVAPPPFVLLFT